MFTNASRKCILVAERRCCASSTTSSSIVACSRRRAVHSSSGGRGGRGGGKKIPTTGGKQHHQRTSSAAAGPRSLAAGGNRRRIHASGTLTSASAASASLLAPEPMIAAASTTTTAAAAAASAGAAPMEAPTISQLQSLFITSAVPMLGFGFMDNFIMITAGGYIDSTLGVQFGLATMTAAALGQVISDTGGVLFGGAMERGMVKMGLMRSSIGGELTSAQRNLPLCRNIKMAGAVLGVMTGCLIGASSLLLLDLGSTGGNNDRKKSSTSELVDVFPSMLLSRTRGGDERLIEAEVCTIYLVDEKDGGLRAACSVMVDGGRDQVVRGGGGSSSSSNVPSLEGSLAEQCAQCDSIVSETVSHHGDDEGGGSRSVLSVPFHSSSSKDGHKVRGVVQFVKETSSSDDGGGESFTSNDTKLAKMVATQAEIFLRSDSS